jgi:hypothetical protein
MDNRRRSKDPADYELAEKLKAADTKLASIRERLESGKDFGRYELSQLSLHLEGLITTEKSIVDSW